IKYRDLGRSLVDAIIENYLDGSRLSSFGYVSSSHIIILCILPTSLPIAFLFLLSNTHNLLSASSWFLSLKTTATVALFFVDDSLTRVLKKIGLYNIVLEKLSMDGEEESKKAYRAARIETNHAVDNMIKKVEKEINDVDAKIGTDGTCLIGARSGQRGLMFISPLAVHSNPSSLTNKINHSNDISTSIYLAITFELEPTPTATVVMNPSIANDAYHTARLQTFSTKANAEDEKNIVSTYMPKTLLKDQLEAGSCVWQS
ncbi:hypothetical protein M8C21_030820, partial [Ambrosia artemisiifolia]